MESFVSTVVTDISTTSVAFVQQVVGNYWGTILSVLFVAGMIGLFWRLGKRVVAGR